MQILVAAEGERDRLACGLSGFKTEEVENGFQFRCVDCNRLARITRPTRKSGHPESYMTSDARYPMAVSIMTMTTTVNQGAVIGVS
jgi:hypothetical protein